MGQWSDWKSPGTAAELSAGSDFSISNYSNLTTYSDASYASFNIGNSTGALTNANLGKYSIYYDSNVLGDLQTPLTAISYDADFNPYNVLSYGSSSTKWGATLTPTIINSATFGLWLQFLSQDADGYTTYSEPILCSNFSFEIPSDDLINGIQWELEGVVGDVSDPDYYETRIRKLRLRVNYGTSKGGLELGCIF